MTALLAQHGTQRHARGTGKTQLLGKPRAPVSGNRHPGPPVQVASQPRATAERLTRSLRRQRKFFPSPAAKGSQQRLGSSLVGQGWQLSETERGVNPSAEGHTGAEPSPPRSGLHRDVKVTDGPQILSQLHTSILEAGRAEARGMLQPPSHPQQVLTGDTMAWRGRRTSPDLALLFQLVTSRGAAFGKGKHKPTQALPRPATHASRGSKAVWP